ncbi:hypothetical protein T12_1129 [Trichinella patagoniensis]|uniref:Uncharacterized protein n=1 Tax=Trichinella patagoniensis TaxID=990121 RepID=A0A0V1A9J6_9BILA|nr:hypothetical protein T12_1129 [Trichinella patagoniensis]
MLNWGCVASVKRKFKAETACWACFPRSAWNISVALPVGNKQAQYRLITILMNIMLIFIQLIMRSRFIRGVFRNDEKFDYIKLRAGYISFGHNDDR